MLTLNRTSKKNKKGQKTQKTKDINAVCDQLYKHQQRFNFDITS